MISLFFGTIPMMQYLSYLVVSFTLLFQVSTAYAEEVLCPEIDKRIIEHTVSIMTWQEVHLRGLSEADARVIARRAFELSENSISPTRCNVLWHIVDTFPDVKDMNIMLWITAGESYFNPRKENLTGEHSCGPTQINLRSNWEYVHRAIGEASQEPDKEALCELLKSNLDVTMKVTRDLYDRYGPRPWKGTFRLIDEKFPHELTLSQ